MVRRTTYNPPLPINQAMIVPGTRSMPNAFIGAVILEEREEDDGRIIRVYRLQGGTTREVTVGNVPLGLRVGMGACALR
jgi:hypothetical protein